MKMCSSRCIAGLDLIIRSHEVLSTCVTALHTSKHCTPQNIVHLKRQTFYSAAPTPPTYIYTQQDLSTLVFDWEYYAKWHFPSPTIFSYLPCPSPTFSVLQNHLPYPYQPPILPTHPTPSYPSNLPRLPILSIKPSYAMLHMGSSVAQRPKLSPSQVPIRVIRVIRIVRVITNQVQ